MKGKSARIDFGVAKVIASFGILIGGAVAIGVPYIVLAFGANVGVGIVVATILSLVGIVGGLALALASAFFGIVIPSKIEASKDVSPEHAEPSLT